MPDESSVTSDTFTVPKLVEGGETYNGGLITNPKVPNYASIEPLELNLTIPTTYSFILFSMVPTITILPSG